MFDMTPDHQPTPPEIDRDAAALAVQDQLGRPLSWAEYVLVWNKCTELMDVDGTREDYIVGVE